MFPKLLKHIHFGKRVKFVQKPGHEDALYNKFFLKEVSINTCDTVH